MQVTKEALDEFAVIWRSQNPGQEIAREELAELARRLLLAVEVVIRPETDNQERDPSFREHSL